MMRHLLVLLLLVLVSPALAFDASLIAAAQQQANNNEVVSGPPEAISASYVAAFTSSPSGSVTIPIDATYLVVLCATYTSSGDNRLTDVDLGTVQLTPRSSTSADNFHVDVWSADVSSLSGSQTLSAERPYSATEGGMLVAVWMSGVSSVRDADGEGGLGDADASITIDSATTDVIVGLSAAYGTAGSLPTNMAWLDTAQSDNSNVSRVFYGDGETTSTTLTVTTQWPYVAGISLQ